MITCWLVRFVSFMSVIAMLACCTQGYAESPPADAGFTNLFDGKSLENWDGDPRFWRVEGETIVGETTKDNPAKKKTFLIYRGKEFSDFELRFSYKVIGYNSGVQYRSADLGNWAVSGYQCDFEDRWHKVDGKPNAPLFDKYSGMLYHEEGRRLLSARGEMTFVRTNPSDPMKPKIEKIGSVGDSVLLEKKIHRDGQWNHMVVIAQGNQFIHLINGHVMTVGIDEDEENRRASGIFAFQLHSGPPLKIELKDVRVREL